MKNARWWRPKKITHRGQTRWAIEFIETGGLVVHGGKYCRPWRFKTRAETFAHMRRRWTRHPEVLCAGQFGRAYIDKKIAPLIKTTWALGIRTEFCCQNQPPWLDGREASGRWVMIKMPHADAVRWLRIALPPRVVPDFWNLGGGIDTHSGKVAVPLFVRFRQRELAGVMARLRAALKSARKEQ